MRLPKEYLKNVSYWECRCARQLIFSIGLTDKVTIHFKQWWKPTKSFVFDYELHDGHFWQPESSRELINQLREEIK